MVLIEDKAFINQHLYPIKCYGPRRLLTSFLGKDGTGPDWTNSWWSCV